MSFGSIPYVNITCEPESTSLYEIWPVSSLLSRSGYVIAMTCLNGSKSGFLLFFMSFSTCFYCSWCFKHISVLTEDGNSLYDCEWFVTEDWWEGCLLCLDFLWCLSYSFNSLNFTSIRKVNSRFKLTYISLWISFLTYWRIYSLSYWCASGN